MSSKAVSIRMKNASPKSDVAKSAGEFTALFRRHHSLVRGVIFQIAGEAPLADLVQDAFVKIWRGLPEFREETQLSSWIYRVATNVALDHLRSVGRKKETSEIDFSGVIDERVDNERDLANRQLVARGLAGLSDDHRVVVVLALIHERPIAEIAEMLDLSEGTVKSRLHYGKEHFRKLLEGSGS